MSSDKIPFKNVEGYPDPTPYVALNNTLRDQKAAEAEVEERMNLLIKTLKNTIRLAGFEPVGRIEVKDTRTGRIFR